MINGDNWLEKLILCSCFFAGLFTQAQEGEKMSFLRIEDGLVNNWISCITQDSKGFIWVGTQDGLHRYDGYNFEVLRNSPEEPRSIAANWIRGIAIDSNNDYWLGSNGGGVTKFSPENMDFTNFSKKTKNDFLGKYVYHMASEGKNSVVSCSEEGFSLFNLKTGEQKDLGIGDLDAPMTLHDGRLWLTEKKNQLFSYDLESHALNHHHTFDSPIQLLQYLPNIGLLVSLPNTLMLFDGQKIVKRITVEENYIHLAQDAQGTFFLASSSTIAKFDPEQFSVQKIRSDLDVSKSNIETLFLDRQGSLWIGTNKGLYKEKKYSRAYSSLGMNLHARRIIKQDGTLYVGGANGLYSIKKDRKTVLINGISVSSLINKGDTIVAGADDGNVYKFVRDTLLKRFSVASKESRKILGLAYDKKQRLWVGSWKGIHVYGTNDKLLKFIPLKTVSNAGEAKITNLHIDSKNRMWITTSAYGVYRVDDFMDIELDSVPEKIINYVRETGNRKSLTTNIIMSLEEDELGQMWFGTEIGVVKYEESTDDFLRLRHQGKLFDKKIMALRKDGANNLWITTISDGIYIYNQTHRTMRHFTQKDGLISSAFLFGSGFYDSQHKMMYFGTDEGVQKIHLAEPFSGNKAQVPLITTFEVNAEEGDSLISPYQTPFIKKISLAPHQNDFSVSFSALDFLNPEKITYAYALDDGPWKRADLQTAYFTNVPYGAHTLQVQALYDGIIQNKTVSSLDINIAPPWYFSSVAKFGYFLLCCATGLGIYLYFKWRWRMQLNLKLKEEEAERYKNLNDFKSNLYTDIAHEFKTPLTLISGPIDSTLQQGNLSDFNKANFSFVQRNTDRLTSLVDQLLELAKLEDGKLKMEVSKGDLALFIQTLSQSFEYQAKSKNMGYDVDIARFGEVWYDEDIIEKIVTNLLSNAFKYSPQNGNCSLSVFANGDYVRISIKNTVLNGSDLQLEKLFTRFYQQDKYSDGMGVGLSLVKELVNVYGGTIAANIEQNDVLHFQLDLPVRQTAFAEEAIRKMGQPPENTAKEVDLLDVNIETPDEKCKSLPLLLIVEDHNEIRAFIKLALQTNYRIVEAENGKAGMEMALSHVPDIILSDVRMPIKNGIELCNAVKNDERTSHIPFILLTASVGEEHELRGLTSGADDYITKPFKVAILQQRIANLVAIRKKLQNRYSKEFVLKPKDIAITPSDEAFLNKVQKILDKHLSDPEFNSESFSKMANMSRMQLHRKLLAFTGLSTSAFIRSQRLSQAINILNSSDLTISEVAYTVGFNTPRYFMKCFKETFKKTPSEYLQTVDCQ